MTTIPAWMVMRALEWAEHDAPNETCGLFTGRNTVEAIQKLTNVAAKPEHFFRMHPKQLVSVANELERKGHRIIGTFHSHPHNPPYPSRQDEEGLRPLNADFHVIMGRSSSSSRLHRGQWWVSVWIDDFDTEWTTNHYPDLSHIRLSTRDPG